jgi:hypothetical protein
MRYCLLLIAIAACLFAQTAKKDKAPSRPAAVTMSGCIGQASDGNFILTDNEELNKIITLHGEGFADEGFAKHLGHQVKVTGRIAKEGDEQVLRVKKIETVSETCHP